MDPGKPTVKQQEFGTQAVDYLQRSADLPAVDAGGPSTEAPDSLRRMLRISAVGRLEKEALPRPGEDFRMISEDLLVGLYNYKIPLALEITAGPGPATVALGTWLPSGAADGAVESNAGVLTALLSSLFPSVELSQAQTTSPPWSHGGLVLGIPSSKPPEILDGSLPVDRLLRALGGGSWSVLVLAQPVDEAITRDLRMRILNEMRAVIGAPAGVGRGPLAEHYVELLRVALTNLTNAQGSGAWRTAVYLTGDDTSYYRLASVWRGIFSGQNSLPEPVRVFDEPAVPELASRWALPDPIGGPSPPGRVEHPFTHQTLLTSSQLAAYVHLPRLESQGFAVRLVPDFDTVPTPVDGERLVLGMVVERDREGELEVAVARDQLTSHAFVTGMTGAGKTNTVFQLVIQADEAQVPFLVIEPAKTEYRALLDHERIGPRLQVFTLGNEAVAPFRLNPFEFPAGIPVGVHLDLLRSVFHVSFGMWTPLPQVIEVCLHEVYRDRGWDVTTNSNYRLASEDDPSLAFPTISELVAKVDEVAARLGYDDEIEANIRAALRTRLNSLRSGAKGRMLDVQRSLEFDRVLQGPAVFELEGLGDDDDKAFVMGLLIVRLAEERRVEGQWPSLRHLLVVEEAHRVVANPGTLVDPAEADVRGKAVETFSNLLSEVRAYGQGVVVVDQIPTKLAPEVIKNTNLKIAHRIVSSDDQMALATAMAMSERQQRALATLTRGRAAVFVDGEDVPLLVKVPKVEVKARAATVDDERVRAHMTELVPALAELAGCRERCGEDAEACLAARSAVENETVQRTVARLVLSTVLHQDALDRLWPDFLLVTAPLKPPWIDREAYLRAVSVHAAGWLAERRGSQAGWPYSESARFAKALGRLLLARALGTETQQAWEELQTVASALDARVGIGPFPACARIWEGEEVPCRCRFAVADLIATGVLDEDWRQATEADAAGDGRAATWNVCEAAGKHLVEFPEDDWPEDLLQSSAGPALRVSLCVGQQLHVRESTAHPRDIVRGINELFQEEAAR
jgi:hypothetical protein